VHVPPSIARRTAEALSRIGNAFGGAEIDRRIEETQKAIKEYQRLHEGLQAKTRQVEAQMLKAMGALEMLEDMKKGAARSSLEIPPDSHGTPPPSSPGGERAPLDGGEGDGLPSENSDEEGGEGGEGGETEDEPPAASPTPGTGVD
jgi:hypothetical protein